MIVLKLNQIHLLDKVESIKEWQVWWRTPKGLFVKMEDAIKCTEENDWPIDVIRPTPVAIGETLYEEHS